LCDQVYPSKALVFGNHYLCDLNNRLLYPPRHSGRPGRLDDGPFNPSVRHRADAGRSGAQQAYPGSVCSLFERHNDWRLRRVTSATPTGIPIDTDIVVQDFSVVYAGSFLGSFDCVRLGNFLGAISRIGALLPAATLAVGLFPILARYIRSSVSNVLTDDFILCLRARGVSESRIIYRHIVKNISVPLITIISQQSGYLLAGAFIVESVFNYPGVGFLGIVAAANRDFPLLQGIVVVVSAIFVLINLAIDVAYAAIDPRIRYT
jgi:hypothetical protein